MNILKLTKPNGHQQLITLDLEEGAVWMVGRADFCKISVPEDSELAEKHCMITRKDGALIIRDNMSPTGISVGGSKILEVVFKYTFLDDDESGIRIVKLYQYLIKAEWLEKETKVDDFRALFLGEPKSFTMKWKGGQQDLYYLIKRMHARKLIQCPKGATKWVITGSHFVDADSRPFADWNKQKDPVKSARAIERLCDVLDITVPLEEFKSR